MVELLAAIPSVVWGFIGLTVMSRLLVALTGAPVGVNVLNGGLILVLMSVPAIVSIVEDALKAVPDSFREAALAMGATRWQVAWRVLLPAARNGLLTAVLLGVGRGVGKTMAVLMATGHAVNIPRSLFDMVFQRPNPRPISVCAVFGLRMHHRRVSRAMLDEAVEQALTEGWL